jgi:hypothetical protein
MFNAHTFFNGNEFRHGRRNSFFLFLPNKVFPCFQLSSCAFLDSNYGFPALYRAGLMESAITAFVDRGIRHQHARQRDAWQES